MNKLDVSQASDPGKRQPLPVRSVAFLQGAYKEALAGAYQAIIGDNYSAGTGYAMQGCRRVSSVSATIASGFFYFAGEAYFFAGISNYTSFSNTGVYVVTVTNGTEDPLTFTDSSQGNVHNVRRVLLLDQANGTGSFNFSDVVYVQAQQFTVGTTGPSFQNSFTTGIAVVYRKAPSGLVTIQGMATKITASSIANQVIFTLPAGYRPSVARSLHGLIFYDTTNLVSDFLNIATNGNVSISGVNTPSFSSGVNVYFTSVSFYAD